VSESAKGKQGGLPDFPTGRFLPETPRGQAPPEFADLAPTPRVFRIFLDEAKSVKKFPTMAANFVWVKGASSPSATVGVRFNSNDASDVEMSEGMVLGGFAFVQLFLTHDAQPGEYVDLMVGRASERLFIVNPSVITSTVTLAKGNNGEQGRGTVAAGATATLSAANATRRRLHAVNEGAFPVRIGLASGAALTDIVGYLLDSGEAITLETTDAIEIYGLSTNGGDTYVSFVEERD
jgi:hypothetical protein